MRRLPGSHAPNIKNRSSKHLDWLTGPGHKPVYRSMSNAVLEELAKGDPKSRNKFQSTYDAQKELNRRAKKRAKKEGLSE